MQFNPDLTYIRAGVSDSFSPVGGGGVTSAVQSTWCLTHRGSEEPSWGVSSSHQPSKPQTATEKPTQMLWILFPVQAFPTFTPSQIEGAAAAGPRRRRRNVNYCAAPACKLLKAQVRHSSLQATKRGKSWILTDFSNGWGHSGLDPSPFYVLWSKGQFHSLCHRCPQ